MLYFFSGHKLCRRCSNFLYIRAFSPILLALIKDVYIFNWMCNIYVYISSVMGIIFLFSKHVPDFVCCKVMQIDNIRWLVVHKTLLSYWGSSPDMYGSVNRYSISIRSKHSADSVLGRHYLVKEKMNSLLILLSAAVMSTYNFLDKGR